MSVLYLMETGAYLHCDGDALVVTVNHGNHNLQKNTTILRQHLQQVFICGNTHISTKALHLCLSEGITVTWLTSSGKLAGRVTPRISG